MPRGNRFPQFQNLNMVNVRDDERGCLPRMHRSLNLIGRFVTIGFFVIMAAVSLYYEFGIDAVSKHLVSQVKSSQEKSNHVAEIDKQVLSNPKMLIYKQGFLDDKIEMQRSVLLRFLSHTGKWSKLGDSNNVEVIEFELPQEINFFLAKEFCVAFGGTLPVHSPPKLLFPDLVSSFPDSKVWMNIFRGEEDYWYSSLTDRVPLKKDFWGVDHPIENEVCVYTFGKHLFTTKCTDFTTSTVICMRTNA